MRVGLFALLVSMTMMAQGLAPAIAQVQTETPESEEAPVLLMDLFDRLLRGFITEIEPQMRELERGFSSLEPELQRFLDEMRGMTQYHPPEVLPNGDILIRRRAQSAPEEAPEPQEEEKAAPSGDPFEL